MAIGTEDGRRFRVFPDLAYLAAAIAFFAVFAWRIVPNVPYGYDESDYLYIAQRGVAAHWLDAPTQSIIEFVRTGLKRGASAEEREALSEQIRASGDVCFYRHWHGPVSFYWLKLVRGVFATGERQTRAAFLVFPIAAAIAAYVFLLRARGRLFAVAVAALLLLSFPNAETAAGVAAHGAFTLAYVVTLLLVSRWLETGAVRSWDTAVIAAAVSLAILEVGIVLAAALAFVAVWERKRIGPPVRFAVRSAALYCGTLLVVWPAAILKLSIVKAWAFMAYLAVARKAAWGSDSVLGSWGLRLQAHPLEWGLVFAGVALWIAWVRKKPEGRMLWPWMVYAALMMIAVGRVASDESRYAAPYFAALQVTSGVAVLTMWPRRTVAALLVLGCGANFAWQCTTRAVRLDRPARKVLDYVAARKLDGTTLLAPRGELPRLHYYFPKVKVVGYDDAAGLERKLAAASPAAGGILLYRTGTEALPAVGAPEPIVQDRVEGEWWFTLPPGR